MRIIEEPSRLSTRIFHFELSRSGHGVWIEAQKKEREYSGEELPAMLLRWLMGRGAKTRR